MRSNRAVRADPCYPTRIHPALARFADECCGMLAHLFAYVGSLVLLAMLGIQFWDQLPIAEAIEPSPASGWSVALRSYPAFAISQLDLPEKTEAYEISMHSEGGRKDVMRWSAPGQRPVAELEIYRPGGGVHSQGAGFQAAFFAVQHYLPQCVPIDLVAPCFPQLK